MVGLFQKRRPVPQDGVLAVHTTGAAQQFGKQLEVDEIAIQAAPVVPSGWLPGCSLAMESVAAFVWNGWQASRGISGRLGVEYAIYIISRHLLVKFYAKNPPNLVEREGFEPSIRSRIHTFQACSFSHSDISPDLQL